MPRQIPSRVAVVMTPPVSLITERYGSMEGFDEGGTGVSRPILITRSIFRHAIHNAIPLLDGRLHMVIEMREGCIEPSFVLISVFVV